MESPLQGSSNSKPVASAGDLERQDGPKKPFYFLPKLIRGNIIAVTGEFIGTVMFLFFAFAGTQVANTLTPPGEATLNQLLFISLSFGFSLTVTAWSFYRISGSLFNPAVTLAMIITGAIPIRRASLFFIPQILGGMVAAALVKCMFPGPLKIDTVLTQKTSTAQGLFIEMFLTAKLVFAVLMLAAEKTKVTFIAPVGIGLALFVAELAGVFFTGGSLNPARSFGPCVANRYFQPYHWIYWVGPALGATIAAGYFRLLKKLKYELIANPGQDDSTQEEGIIQIEDEDHHHHHPRFPRRS